MKYYWKLFFAIMLTCSFFLSLGGFALIETGFQKSYDREAASARQMNSLLYYSLKKEAMQEYSVEGNAVLINEKAVFSYFAKSVSFGQTTEGLQFRILDLEHKVVYSNFSLKPEIDWKEKVPQGELVYFLDREQDKKIIRVLRPFKFWGDEYYLENLWDVTNIYNKKQEQYQIFVEIIAAMLIFGGCIAAVISYLLVKPLKRLSTASTLIGKGNLSLRIPVRGTDEVAMLSSQFNFMTEALQRKIELIEEEARNKELFVAAFSHEIKTPLTAMIGFSQRILGKAAGDSDLEISAGYIFEEGRRLEQLSMRLMDLIVLDREEIELEAVTASFFFSHVINLVSPMLNHAGITLEAEIEEGILWIEPTLMETVCVNLIDNARKASSKGGSIRIRGVRRENGYTFSVTDEGIGMNPEVLSQITKAFYMADKSRSRKEGGAGLGLAICDKIIRMHQAKLEISSEQGRGTSMSVLLYGYSGEEEDETME